MKDAKKIEAHIEKHNKWEDQLVALRAILNASVLVETVKWGCPSYTLGSSILISLAGFMNHCAIWFHQGVFLEDVKSVLISANMRIISLLRNSRRHGSPEWRRRPC